MLKKPVKRFARIFSGRQANAPPPSIVQADDPRPGRTWNDTTPGGTDEIPAPIASVSVGTTGLRRTRRFLEKMYAAGCADRIQSLCVYDCNRTTIGQWQKTQSQSTAAKTILPDYIPLSEGFLRNNKAFQSYYGKIERDLERMADTMYARANEAGTPPQVILEWIGFGGHSLLSYLFHNIVLERFPDSTFLPIICLPYERILEQKMRNEVWDTTISAYADTKSIITDNAVDKDLSTIDHRLGIALASIESAYRASPESGTLAEIATMFGMTDSKYLGIAETSIPMRIENGSIVLGQDDSTIYTIKQAIWSIAEEQRRYWLAHYSPHERDAEQRIIVSVPTDRTRMLEFADDILDQLRREDFEMAYAGTKIAFAPANFNWNRDADTQDTLAYAHITKIFATGTGPQPSIERILQPGYAFDNGRIKSAPTRGKAIRNGHRENAEFLQLALTTDHSETSDPAQ